MNHQQQFNENYQWQRKFQDEIIGIIAKVFVKPAPRLDDMNKNTDFMVLSLDTNARVACRVRRYEYLRYSNEFTIRARNGTSKTEFPKIIRGFGDFMFYGFASKDESYIVKWTIIDLSEFREQVFCHVYMNKRLNYKENRDGRTGFFTFPFDFFDKKIVFASSE